MDGDVARAHNDRVPPVVGKSWLRRSFDRAERLVGAPLEDVVRTRQFADAVVLALKIQKGGSQVVEGTTRRLLHLWNIPTRSDVMRVSRQVASLENTVRAMALALERDELAVSRVSGDETEGSGDGS